MRRLWMSSPESGRCAQFEMPCLAELFEIRAFRAAVVWVCFLPARFDSAVRSGCCAVPRRLVHREVLRSGCTSERSAGRRDGWWSHPACKALALARYHTTWTLTAFNGRPKIVDQATSQAPCLTTLLDTASAPSRADPLTHGLPYSLAQVGPCADHLPAPSTSRVPPRRPHCCVLHNYWRAGQTC
jgi:hypothetical protein